MSLILKSKTKQTLQNGRPDYHRVASELFRCNRLAILGNQGAGKSTLAEKLRDILRLDYVDIEWRPGEATAIRERMARQERWVVDGDFGLLDLADRVIFLDFPVTLCLWRATKRAIENLRVWSLSSPRALVRIPPKTLELFGFLAAIFKDSSRPCPGTASNWVPNGHTITFTSPKQLDALLEALNSRKRSEEKERAGICSSPAQQRRISASGVEVTVSWAGSALDRSQNPPSQRHA
jgi:energy-coupling factor transporter ATP-binding protein EcfA2